MKKIRDFYLCTVLVITLIISCLLISGCSSEQKEIPEENRNEQSVSPEITSTDNDSNVVITPSASEITPVSEITLTPEPTPTLEPTPTPDPEPIATELANKLNIPVESLNGKYDLFVRYRDAIESNPDLHEYKNFIYHIFPYVAKYTEEVNEEYLLERVSTLGFEKIESFWIAGSYDSGKNIVNVVPHNRMGEGYYARAVYHELMHFLDYNINGSLDTLCYMKDGSFKYQSTLSLYENEDIVQTMYNSFFIEGGAELFSCELIKSLPSAYWSENLFLAGLEYIFGCERIEQMFFSTETDGLFTELLMENGFSSEEIVKLYNTMPYIGSVAYPDPETTLDPKEVLIRLYINNIGPDFKEDAAFCRIITYEDTDDRPVLASKYKEFTDTLIPFTLEQQDKMISYFIAEGVDSHGWSKWFWCNPIPFYLNGELKLVGVVWFTEDDNNEEFLPVVMDYDFEKNRVKSFEVLNDADWIPGDIPGEKIPEDSTEANEVLSKLLQDNSEAHHQEVKKSNSDLSELYERVVNIGNRYGIYIWFKDLIPDGVLSNPEYTDPEKSDISKALDDIENVLSLYPEDYFDSLLFKYYSGIFICIYDGWYEKHLTDSNIVFIDGKRYFAIYVDVSSKHVQGYFGADVIKDRYFSEISNISTGLVLNIWSITEKVIMNRMDHYEKPPVSEDSWAEYNYDEFTYLNLPPWEEEYLQSDLEEKEPETKMEYFLCRESLANAKTDRCLLNEYLMLSALTSKQISDLSWESGSLIESLTPECIAKAKELYRWIRTGLAVDFQSWGRFFD